MREARISGYPSRGAGIGRRFKVALAAMLVPALVISMAVATSSAAAAAGVGTVGPVDPAIGFPTFFGDSGGQKMAPCLDGLPLCTATAADLVAPNGEAFYSLSRAIAGPFDLTLAVEGAFLGGQRVAFQRTRFYTPKLHQLQPGATYTVVEPYGTHTIVADSGGSVLRKDSTTDLGCLAAPCGDFVTALNGPITSSAFLTWDTYTGTASPGAPPLGYVGDNATPHAVAGSPTGNNLFQVSGPGVGGPGVDTVSTGLFTVLGKAVTGPAAAVQPAGVLFGNNVVGIPVTRTVTVVSKGVEPLFVGGSDPLLPSSPPMLTGPDAGQYGLGVDTCSGTSLPPTGTCTVDVVYTPVPGPSSAILTILTNAGPQAVALSGQSSPVGSVSPAALPSTPANFGPVQVGRTGVEKSFTLTNTGGAPMTMTGVSVTPNPNDFTVTSTCAAGAVIAPGSNCTATVGFLPSSPVVSTATISFDDDATGSPQTVTVTGTGIQSAVALTAPAPFATTTVGSVSAGQTVTLTNTGTAPLNVGSVGVGGPAPFDFQESDNCFGAGSTFVLAPNASCQATVSFGPTAVGSRRALLLVTDDAPGSPHSVPLAGLGVAPAPVVPGSPTIGTATPGNATATVDFTAPASDGGAAITGYTISAVSASGTVTASALSTATSATVTGLANGTSYQLKVATINSVGTGAYSALSNPVTPNPPPAPAATLSPASLAFPATSVGSNSAAQTATLTNNGTATLNITGIAVGGVNAADFVKGTSTCGSTLGAGASCTTPISFRPTAGGARSAFLTMTDSAVGSPHSFLLNGSGTVSIPTVTAKSPAPAATGIALGTATARTPVTATFGEAVTGLPTAAAATANFTLTLGGAVVTSSVVYNPTTRVATLTPAAPLLTDRSYTATLTSAIRSGSGGALAGQSWTFVTGPQPTVTSNTPAGGSTAVSVGTATVRTPVTATFSEAVTGLPTTATSTANFILRQGATVVPSKVLYSSITRVATLTPSAPMVADRTYTVILSSGIKDPAGNPIVARTWTFVTGPRPTVTAHAPATSAVGVSRIANVTATFSEAVTGLPAAAASGNFTVRQTATGAAFPSVVSYNATTRVATCNPTGTLLAKTQYTVTLSAGIRDVAGNPLAAVSWSFTTGAA